jgi:hypothetical protein
MIYIIIYFIYLNFLEIYYLDLNKKLILILNFLIKFNIYTLILYKEYFNKNILIDLDIFKKSQEIEKLFFYYYLK